MSVEPVEPDSPFSEYELAQLHDLETRVRESSQKVEEERRLRESAEREAEKQEKRARIAETLQTLGVIPSKDILRVLDGELRWNSEKVDWTTETTNSINEAVENTLRAHPHLGASTKTMLDERGAALAKSRSGLDLDAIQPGMPQCLRDLFWAEIGKLYRAELEGAKI